MDTEYCFITPDGFECCSQTFEEAEIMAEYYGVSWLDIKKRNVFVDCAVRDGNI